MNREQIAKLDFENDRLPPDIVHQHLIAHDRRMREIQPDMAKAKASYLTKWWDWVEGSSKSNSDDGYELFKDRIEVNRLKPAISAYLAALYPRATKAILAQDPTSAGDVDKAELTLNTWVNQAACRERILLASRQGLLYHGAGGKVGYEAGTSSPMARTWMRCFPYWEMVLDQDVHDSEDQRFVGHVYYRPRHEVEEEYDLPALAGTFRSDFLDESALTGGVSARTRRTSGEGAESDEAAFVRVLELCNLVDTIEDEDNPGAKYLGRLEIYVLDQGELSRKPIWVGPLPFANADGSPLPHIVPLIFENEPEYPLRGVPYAQQLLPQAGELNCYRTFMAQASRKDSRQYLARPDAFDGDETAKLTEARDGEIIFTAKTYEGPLEGAIIPIKNAPVSSAIKDYARLVEIDLDKSMTLSPAARQEVTRATKTEVEIVEQYTESEFGRHAEARDRWLSKLLHLALRAMIASMQDSGADRGRFDEQEADGEEVDVAPIGATDEDHRAELNSTDGDGEPGEDAQAFPAEMYTEEEEEEEEEESEEVEVEVEEEEEEEVEETEEEEVEEDEPEEYDPEEIASEIQSLRDQLEALQFNPEASTDDE